MGYITYTLKEDAEKAVEELNNGPFGGAARKIRVELAGDKVGHNLTAPPDFGDFGSNVA